MQKPLFHPIIEEEKEEEEPANLHEIGNGLLVNMLSCEFEENSILSSNDPI